MTIKLTELRMASRKPAVRGQVVLLKLFEEGWGDIKFHFAIVRAITRDGQVKAVERVNTNGARETIASFHPNIMKIIDGSKVIPEKAVEIARKRGGPWSSVTEAEGDLDPALKPTERKGAEVLTFRGTRYAVQREKRERSTLIELAYLVTEQDVIVASVALNKTTNRRVVLPLGDELSMGIEGDQELLSLLFPED